MAPLDALIVGAGPAGSTAAYELARRGHRVLVVEEHARVGHPVQCAGLVSQRVLDLAGSSRFVLGPVHGARVFSPSLRSITFRAPEPRAFVIDRAGLDIHLADRAARAGAEYRCGTRFEGFEPPDGPGRIARVRDPSGSEQRLRARLVIGADGVTSGVARAARLRRPVEILPAFEALLPSSPGDPDLVEVYLGADLAPGLFGWWIGDFAGGARVGVAARADGTTARQYYERLVQRMERRFGVRLPPPVGFVVSGIPIGTLPHLVADRVLLVGDAAAQVKPLSGGGIYTGMLAARLAAEVAAAGLERDRLDAADLRPYALAYDRAVGTEFRRAHYLRRLFARLTDTDFERLVEALQGAGLTEAIVAFGDIDFPTHVARRLLRQSPSLLRLLPKALGAWWPSTSERAPELEAGPRRRPAT